MATALSTDLYELTMAAGYFEGRADAIASFELFVRELPPERAYLVAAGLDQALSWLQELRFTAEEIAYLRTIPALRRAPADFFDSYLPACRFTGDVWAVAEGTPAFANEPLLRVTAPIIEAQIVETALLATVVFQTGVASRASRIVRAAAGRPVFEFGTRRAHGVESGLLAARAACIGGCEGTSNLAAGRAFNLTVSGTMAHSWVMAHASEREAFERFAGLYGDQAVLLLDTYGAIEAVGRIAAARLEPAAVRIDSGDLLEGSRAVRGQLDASGLSGTRIIASGDLDEHRIAALLAADAPIDAFGVGTALSTVADAPALGGVYKLVEIERDGRAEPVLKMSREKATLPGRKQVWRFGGPDGAASGDLIGCAEEAPPAGGTPLLDLVMLKGQRLAPAPPVAALRDRCRRAVDQLPPSLLRLARATPYRVDVSETLVSLAATLGLRLGSRGVPHQDNS